MSASDKAPRLSICIPTHNGRRDCVVEAVTRLSEQLTPELGDEVEVCVSDNASRDGTEAGLSALAGRNGLRLVYKRNERDIGGWRNVLAVTAMATGEYLWLFSSDDAIAPGGLGRVLELLDAVPGVPGISVNATKYDVTLTVPVPATHPGPLAPDHYRTRLYTGFEEIIRRCGPIWPAIANHIVRADLWKAEVEALTPAAKRASRMFVHMLLLAGVARRNPAWIWCPARLVDERRGQSSLEGDDIPEPYHRFSQFFDEATMTWRYVLGRKDPIYRYILELLFPLAAGRDAIAVYRGDENFGVRAAVSTLFVFGRAFWLMPAFWLETVPAVVTPKFVLARAGRPADRNPRTDIRVRIEASVSESLPAEDLLSIPCRVTNVGESKIPRRGVALSYRWRDAATDAVVASGLRTELPRALDPGESADVSIQLLTLSPSEATLALTLVQEGVAWLDDLVAPDGGRHRVATFAAGWDDEPAAADDEARAVVETARQASAAASR